MDVVTIAVKAAQDLYTGLAFTPKPTLWAERQIPTRDTLGTATNFPFARIRGEPLGVIDWMNELDRTELVRLTLDVYGTEKALVSGYVNGIMYNGAAPGARAGFDDAATLSLPTGYTLNKMERQTPGTVFQEEHRGVSGGLIYRATLVYDVELFRDGDLGT